MNRRELLQLLADGEYHSGQELADVLGVSRTAVWKQLGKLEELGLNFDSIKGKGYRLVGGLDLLQDSLLRSHLSEETLGLLSDLQIVDVIDSTNAELMRRLEAGDGPQGLVCTAEQQSAGRGRRGRQWISPYGSNVYLSVSWGFENGAAALEGLSLAVGVVISDALSEFGVDGLALKWPNDLLIDSAKLGGVLIEMSGDVAGPCSAVVGVGLNVCMPEAAAGAIDQSWTDLASQQHSLDRNRLLSTMLNHLMPLLASYEREGLGPWLERWKSLDAYADRPVMITAGERKLAGTARGIDANGALLLETELGVQPIYGGEVSLRARS